MQIVWVLKFRSGAKSFGLQGFGFSWGFGFDPRKSFGYGGLDFVLNQLDYGDLAFPGNLGFLLFGCQQKTHI